MESLKNFRVAKFNLCLSAEEALLLPEFKGSTFRGGFGHAFKKVVCTLRDKTCSQCMLKEKCVYSYVFETPPPSDARIMRKYPSAPHPFIINSPLEKKRQYGEGEKLEFQLTLIGRAIDYLPYFIYTFEELGKIGLGKGRGRFRISQVLSLDNHLKGTTIYKGEEKILQSKYPSLKVEDLLSDARGSGRLMAGSSRKIKLNFLTPTRMKFGERYILDLEFHIFLRNLLRRISLLSYFHCGDELELDFKGLISRAMEVKTEERSLSWYDWERYSSRQDTRMKLGGFVGEIVFEGDLKEFLPFILLGEQVNVGKGTSFGLGRYEVKDK